MRVRRLWGACLGAGALLLATSSASGAAEMTSVNIVEPRQQSRWGYEPGTQVVQPGTWITWSNAGQDPHTVTAVDSSFDSGDLAPSEGFSWLFADPGTFEYYCIQHPWMKGTVIVGDGAIVETPPPVDDPVPADESEP